MKNARRIIFWSHLSVGITAGLVILTMSVTGTLLTYERQLHQWADAQYAVSKDDDRTRLPIDLYSAIANGINPNAKRLDITLSSDPEAAVSIKIDRQHALLLDPYTGQILRDGHGGMSIFFTTVTRFHRWFALQGEAQEVGRAVTGYSNLLFMFLLLSGAYLWLPRVWKATIVRAKVLFNRRTINRKARDYNWHHVFGFWSSLPLVFIISSATVFYFPWATEALYKIFGEAPPEQRQNIEGIQKESASTTYKSHEDLFLIAEQHAKDAGLGKWRTIAIQLSGVVGSPVNFRIDQSIGGQPQHLAKLRLDGMDGRVIDWVTFSGSTPATRTRSIVRYLHTGEVLGVAGQTIAGWAALSSCFLVWTGLSLAWRRLIRPL